MLDAKDLELLQSMTEHVVAKQISKLEFSIAAEMGRRMDDRFAKSENSILDEIDRRMDNRFAKSESSILRVMDNRFAKSENSILNEMDRRMDDRFAKSENSILSEIDRRMDDRFAKSENLVLDEMERTRRILEGKIQTVQNNLDDIREYYRISKLEQDNSALLLCIVSDLQKRVDLLEQKTA